MFRLLSLVLASVPLAGPALADTPADAPHARGTLVGRSINLTFAERILYRSTGVLPARLREPAVERTSTVVKPPEEPVILERPTRPEPERALPTFDPARHIDGLSRTILGRIGLYDDLIELYSRMNDLDPNLVRAVIYVESGGDPGAQSHKGARGLMQLMPGTAKDVGVLNPSDPAQNIYGGTRYLASLIERFKRLDLALWGYNAGPETVVRRRLPLETRRYIPAVLRVKALLDEQEGV